MNTILTDDALIDAIRKAGLRVIGPHKILARAVEAAVLAKLREQEPFGWWHQGETEEESDFHLGDSGAGDDCSQCIPLYTHPAPQQADRQRVPANKANNELNRVIQHAITLGSEADPFLRCWNEGNWDECREFDFEPALPYEIEEQADRQRVPDGYVLVSKDRLKALSASIHGDCYMAEEWEKEAVAAMLAAALEAPAQPHKLPIPPAGADAFEVVYTEGWNAACEAFFGGKPAPEPLVVTVHTQGEAPAQASAVDEREPLTPERVDELSHEMVRGNKSVNWLVRAIERAHGIGDAALAQKGGAA